LNIDAFARSLGITHVTALDTVERLGLFGFLAVRPGALGPSTSLGAAREESEARRRALLAAIGAALSERARPVILESEQRLRITGHPMVSGSELGLGEGAPRAMVPWIEGRFAGGGPVWLPYAAIHGMEIVPEPPGGTGVRGGLGSGETPAAAVEAALADAVTRRALGRLIADPAAPQGRAIALGSGLMSESLRVRGRVSAEGVVLAIVWDGQGGIGLAGSANAAGGEAAWDEAFTQAVADWSARRAGLYDSACPLDQDPQIRAAIVDQPEPPGDPIGLEKIDPGPRPADRATAIDVAFSHQAAELSFAQVVLRLGATDDGGP
jgi:hypothetical protein